MFSYMMSHPVRFLKENRDISVTHTLINVIAFACYQIRKKEGLFTSRAFDNNMNQQI